ncbi:MAG: PilZ domain-containing protein [bacterium]
MQNLFDAARDYQVAERRREARLACEYPALVTILSVPSGKEPPKGTITCVATNISLSGTRIAIATFAAIEVGTIARIKLKCGLFKTFVFAGKARNIRRDSRNPICFAGFEINSTSMRTINGWRKFISRHFRAPPSRAGRERKAHA